MKINEKITVQTLIIVFLIALPLGIYIGMQYSDNNTQKQNKQVVEAAHQLGK